MSSVNHIIITCVDVFKMLKASHEASIELSHECSVLIKEFYQVLAVKKSIHAFFVTDVTEVSLTLNDHISLKGTNCLFFQDSNEIQLYSITLGTAVDEWISSINDDVLHVLADSIANCYIGKLVETWLSAEEEKLVSGRFTRRIEFGCEIFPLEEVDKLKTFIDDLVIMSPYHSLRPAKSLVFLVGVSTSDECNNESISCDYCNQAVCSLRKDDRCLIRVHTTHGTDAYQVKPGVNLYRFLLEKDYQLNGDCGGKGTCGKCITIVQQIGSTLKHEILTCQFSVSYDCEIFLNEPEDSKSNIEESTGTIKPLGNDLYGFAIDIGTTTIQVALVNITKQLVVDQVSEFNPQRVYGSDVIARIQYTIDYHDGLTQLNHILMRRINKMCEYLINQHQVNKTYVKEIQVVGNTVMEHIFTNTVVTSIGFAPYKPVWRELAPRQSRSLGFSFDATVHIAPVVSGFIGGDFISGLLMIPNHGKYHLVIDLGTNGEIAIVTEGNIVACSTAIGPAFEGGNIECGMVATIGAISNVSIKQGNITYTTISGKATGLCGSGMISVICELLKAGIINETGTFVKEKLSEDDKKMMRYSIVDSIYISQQDIRNIQLAKSALRTGLEILLKEVGLKANQIDQVYLAGAFGNAVDLEDLIQLGLLPKKWHQKIKFMGNLSIEGATHSLLRSDATQAKIDLAKKIKVIELANHPQFLDLFVEYMQF